MPKLITMKQFIIFVILSIFSTTIAFSQADEVKWLSWNEGYPLAKKKDKILLIDLYTDWCGWCKRMDRDTYSKPDIIKEIEKHYVAVKFNPELKNLKYEVEGKTYTGMQLYGMLIQNQRTGYPTTVFLYTKEKKLYLEPGYKNAEQFRQLLTKYKNLEPK
jgi:thioredoxin-related protein